MYSNLFFPQKQRERQQQFVAHDLEVLKDRMYLLHDYWILNCIYDDKHSLIDCFAISERISSPVKLFHRVVAISEIFIHLGLQLRFSNYIIRWCRILLCCLLLRHFDSNESYVLDY